MRIGVILFFVSFIVFFSSCLVTINGNIEESKTSGFETYINKHLKYSVLIPSNWNKEMTIGGTYHLTPKKDSTISIDVRSSLVEQFSGLQKKQVLSLEDYKKYRLSLLTENQIGPHLEYTIQEDSLSGFKAFKLIYTFNPKAYKTTLYQIEIFTLDKGRIYTLYYYANINNYKSYLREFNVVKKSFRILD